MSRIWRHPHSYGKFPVECENHSLQAEIWSDHRNNSYFQNGRHKVAVKKSNHNSRPKNTLKRYIISNLLVQNLLPAQFSFYCSDKLSKFKMAAKNAGESYFLT